MKEKESRNWRNKTVVWHRHGTILLQLSICHPVVCVWL